MEPTSYNKELYSFLIRFVPYLNNSDALTVVLLLISQGEDLEAFKNIIALEKCPHSTQAEHAAQAISRQRASLRGFSHHHLERCRHECRREMRRYGR